MAPLPLGGAVVGDGDLALVEEVLVPPGVVDSGTEAMDAGVGNRSCVVQEGTYCTPGWVGIHHGERENAPLDATNAHLPWHAAADWDTPGVDRRLLHQSGEAAAAAATSVLPFAAVAEAALLSGVDYDAVVRSVHRGFESHVNRAWYCHHGNWQHEIESYVGNSRQKEREQQHAVVAQRKLCRVLAAAAVVTNRVAVAAVERQDASKAVLPWAPSMRQSLCLRTSS